MSRVAPLCLTEDRLTRRDFRFQVRLDVVDKTSRGRSFVFRCVHGGGEVANVEGVVRRSVAGSLLTRFFYGGFYRFFYVAVRQTVDCCGPFFNLVAARAIVGACRAEGFLYPCQAVDEAGDHCFRILRFLWNLLCQHAVFTCGVEVVTRRFVPVGVYVGVYVGCAAVRYAGAARDIAKGRGAFHFVGDGRHFKPIGR